MRTLALLLLITPLLAQEDPPPNIIVTPNQGLRINVDPNPDREPAFDEITAANNPPAPDSNTALPDTFQTEPLDDGVRVSILGYHEFSSDRPNTAMRIQTGKFRRQMEAIRNLGYPVITMDEFMAWKRGQNELPPRCFLITIDDGWKSVYTEAYPILKEMNLPFTLFLYKKYVDGGGRALSSEMINEMLSSGLCTIGSHSVSHPFPSKFRAAKKKGPDTYKAFLQSEFGDSKIFLEQRFGQPVPTYAYPGGYITEDMHPVADEVGYEFLFSVNPGMTRLDSKNHSLPRYIILGNTDSYFELATTFRKQPNQADTEGITIQTTAHPVTPRAGSLTSNRLPLIAADLSSLTTIDPDSLVMRVGGFGKVPAQWNPSDKTFSWRVNRPLRAKACEISVQWRLKENPDYDLPMKWSFRLDLEDAYRPR